MKTLAVYNADGQMIGYETQQDSTSNDNDESSIMFKADGYYENADRLAFMMWYADTQEPAIGGFKSGFDRVMTRDALPQVIGFANNPAIALSVNRATGTVTVNGTGFAAYSLVTFLAANNGGIDYAGQVKANDSGGFSVTYKSGCCLELPYNIRVTAGGQGATAAVVGTAQNPAAIGKIGFHSAALKSGASIVTAIPAAGAVSVDVELCYGVRRDASIISAVYVGGKLLTLERSTVRIGFGVKKVNVPITLPSDRSDVSIALFLWDPVTYEPLSDAVRFE